MNERTGLPAPRPPQIVGYPPGYRVILLQTDSPGVEPWEPIPAEEPPTRRYVRASLVRDDA